MAIVKCKMCGGDIELTADKTFGTCEYCGNTMTLPKIDDEQRAAAFNRGNHFRRIGEFDKALAVYERIVREDDTDAEAHWCCALCRFGIEYVEDPATFEWMPTCHRASFDSFLEDVDYKAAVEYSDGITRRQYIKDGAKIAEVQRGILATSQNAEPYDVFICYKESDANGDRTRDSLMAQDIYYQLTEQGRKVFFARITLEDVAGEQYEPYIFAALNSAKVMIVVGTKAEHLNAVWVKNEWNRFLAMMKKDRSKLLLPCYRDMDPYDMPEQLSVLQSYDMGKIGFIQDLTRGIAKVLDAEKKPELVKETVVVQQSSAPATNTAPLLKRAFIFLEDGDWNSADEYCERVLDLDPECAEAYLGKLMSELRVRKQEDLKDQANPFDGMNNYQKVLRFGDDKLKAALTGYTEHINTRNKNVRLTNIYNRAKSNMYAATVESAYIEAAHLFESISEYEDAATLAQTCYKCAKIARKDAILAAETSRKNTIYTAGLVLMNKSNRIKDFQAAIEKFQEISGWKDADEMVYTCQKKIEEIKAKAEAERLERERKAEIDRLEAEHIAKRNKKIAMIVTPIVCVTIVLAVIRNEEIKNNQYNDAVALMDAGMHQEALSYFFQLNGYKDSETHLQFLYNQLSVYWDQLAVRETISAGLWGTAGLKSDGSVVAVGRNDYGQCDVSGWKDIVAISAGEYHTVGLKADGSVVAVGTNSSNQCNVSSWKGIVAISAGEYHTVGLKADSSVVAVGSKSDSRCNVSDWKDIVAISAGEYHTVGLKADGSVVAVGKNDNGQCDVSGWKEIVAISAGAFHTVGLKADGSVVVVGLNTHGQCDVSDWIDIVAISASTWHTVGLKSDGTVVAVGWDSMGRLYAENWTNIQIP